MELAQAARTSFRCLGAEDTLPPEFLMPFVVVNAPLCSQLPVVHKLFLKRHHSYPSMLMAVFLRSSAYLTSWLEMRSKRLDRISGDSMDT